VPRVPEPIFFILTFSGKTVRELTGHFFEPKKIYSLFKHIKMKLTLNTVSMYCWSMAKLFKQAKFRISKLKLGDTCVELHMLSKGASYPSLYVSDKQAVMRSGKGGCNTQLVCDYTRLNNAQDFCDAIIRTLRWYIKSVSGEDMMPAPSDYGKMYHPESMSASDDIIFTTLADLLKMSDDSSE
jgi:hypothetical protein